MGIVDIKDLVTNKALLKNLVTEITKGKVVVFPSDTSYGLACNPSDPKAVERLFLTKNRPQNKQISCIFKDLDQIKKWAKVSPWQEMILKNNLSGPFTFLLEALDNYPLDGELVGVRIPDNKLTNLLSQNLDFPYTATSCNITGEPEFYDSGKLIRYFSQREFKPDIVVDTGELPYNLPSTVASLVGDKVTTIRTGTKVVNPNI